MTDEVPGIFEFAIPTKKRVLVQRQYRTRIIHLLFVKRRIKLSKKNKAIYRGFGPYIDKSRFLVALNLVLLLLYTYLYHIPGTIYQVPPTYAVRTIFASLHVLYRGGCRISACPRVMLPGVIVVSHEWVCWYRRYDARESVSSGFAYGYT